MKKSILAIFLAVIAMVQVHAQDSDLRSAPDLPTFKVTFTVDNGNGGSIYEGNMQLTNGQSKEVYGSRKAITMVAYKGKRLSKFLAGSDTQLPTATLNSEGNNSYAYTLTLDKETTLQTVWADKRKVGITVTGTEQIVSDNAAVVTVSTDVEGLTLTPAYYKNKECTAEATDADRKKVGTYYVKLVAKETVDYLAVDTVIALNVVDKIGLTIQNAPTASEGALQDEALSTVKLAAGKVVSAKDQSVVEGTWAWTTPAAILKPGTNAYQATFTPANKDFAVITCDVTVKAKYVTTVNLTQTTGGKVEIKTAAVNGKYIGTVDGVATLEVWATPDAGYRFKEWNNSIKNPTEGAGSETAVIRKDIPATGTISAVFEKATRAVKLITSGGGTLKLGNTPLIVGDNPFEYGDDLTITMLADTLKMLGSLKVDGVDTKLTNASVSNYPNRNYYVLKLGKREKSVTLEVVWVDKPKVNVTVSGTEQIVNASKAAEVSVKTDIATLAPTIGYYKDKECTMEATPADRMKVGTFYVKITLAETSDHQAVDMIVTLRVTEKKPLGLKEDLRIEKTMLEGQMLSSVTIPDGKVYMFETETLVPGHWEWLNASVSLKAGEDQVYEAIYIPQDTLTYNKLEAQVKVSAKYVTHVYTAQSAGGYVYIDSASVDNKYVGTTTSVATVKAIAVPYAGYKFVKWADGTGTASEKEVSKVFEAKDKLTLSATFEQATREIKLTSSGEGSVNLAGTTKNQAIVGSTVVIEATPNAGNEVESISYKLSTEPAYQTGASFIVGGGEGASFDVKVAFKAKQPDRFVINVDKVRNGSLLLKQGETIVAPGSSVEKNAVLSVIAMPDRGYELASLSQGGNAIENGSLTVTENTTITATFEKKTYPLTIEAPVGVTISGVTAGTVVFGDELQPVANVTDVNKYKLLSLVVNNKPIASGSKIIVDGPVHVTAQVRELIPFELLNSVDSADYNGEVRSFVAKTLNGLTGFTYTYSKENPTDVGEYTVTVKRPADDIYQAFERKATFKINPVLPKVTEIPFLSQFKNNEYKVEGVGTWHLGTLTKTMLRAATDNIYFVPENKNYKPVDKVIAVADNTVKAVNVTLTNTSMNGTALLKIGDLPVSADMKTYKGQTITVNAVSAAGYRVDWSKISGLDANHSVTLGDNNVGIDVSSAFVAKGTPKVSEKTIAKTYIGGIPSISAKDLSLTPNDSKWRISYQKDGSSAIPTTVGSYEIWASREEDDTYKAADMKAGTLTIKAATVKLENITLPTATAIRKGNALSLSHLDGGLVKVGGNLVIGTFEWENPDATIDQSGLQTIIFKPLDTNYQMSEDKLQVYVTLQDEPLRTMTLIGVNNSVSITDATGASLASGAKVPQGSLIRIVSKDGSTIESVKVNGTPLIAVDGVYSYTVGGEDFTITITYVTYTPLPDDVRVTGVSLDATSKTLAVGESFTLRATVTPSNATMKSISWSSSDETVATVDANGVVTALKIGTCKITVATNDGNKTASCTVTVSGTVGIEQIELKQMITTERGAIRISTPQQTQVQIFAVNGTYVYEGNVNGAIRIPATTGIYLVRIEVAGKNATAKVNVR
ncbi:Ig-like domain-containing protein [Parabacteroides sp.]